MINLSNQESFRKGHKGHLGNVDIMLNHSNKIISNDHGLVKFFNEHYINVIEKSRGEKPTNINNTAYNDKQAVDITFNSCENHPSLLKIRTTITAKENCNDKMIFSPVNSDEVK